MIATHKMECLAITSSACESQCYLPDVPATESVPGCGKLVIRSEIVAGAVFPPAVADANIRPAQEVILTMSNTQRKTCVYNYTVRILCTCADAHQPAFFATTFFRGFFGAGNSSSWTSRDTAVDFRFRGVLFRHGDPGASNCLDVDGAWGEPGPIFRSGVRGGDSVSRSITPLKIFPS